MRVGALARTVPGIGPTGGAAGYRGALSRRGRRYDGPLVILLAPLLAGLAGLAAGGDGPACPYCANDPSLLKAAGLVSHGPFPFAKDDSERVRSLLRPAPLLFLESAHFRIGSSLEAYSVS